MRAASLRLFGNLSRFGDGPSAEPFLEQIHANFVSLLVHVNDADEGVRKAAKAALKLVGPLTEAPATNAMLQKFLSESTSLHYGEFMNDLSKQVIKELAPKVNFYTMNCVHFFKSSYTEVRANAAMLTGARRAGRAAGSIESRRPPPPRPPAY